MISTRKILCLGALLPVAISGHTFARQKQSMKTNGTFYLETHSLIWRHECKNAPTDTIELKNVYLPDKECDLVPHYNSNGRTIFPLWVEMERIK